MNEIDAKDIPKMDLENEETKKPYVVYLPEEEVNKVKKNKIKV